MANVDNIFSDISKVFKVWLETPLGQAFYTREQQIIELLSARAFSHYSVHLGPCEPFWSEKLANAQYSLSLQPDLCLCDLDLRYRQVIFHPDQLPLATDSIDLVIVRHGLDISDNPHQLLREVARVVIPGGRIIIAGFNPLSSWGVWRLLRFKIGVPWCNRFLALGRLTDWLNLLNFQKLECYPFFFHLPFNRAACWKSVNFMEQFCSQQGIQMGAGYVLSAVKLETRVNLLKPRWQSVVAKSRFSLASANTASDYEPQQNNKSEV